MKKLLLSLIVAATALTASAQTAGLHFIVPATNYIPAASTNLSISAWTNSTWYYEYPGAVLTVNEFNTVGLTCTAYPTNSVTNTATFVFVQSFDNGVNFEPTPSIRVPMALSGISRGWAGGAVGVTGATHIAIHSIEWPGAQPLSNVTIKAYLKMVKRGARQATQ